MKKNVVKGALIAAFFAVAVPVGVSHSLNRGFSSVVLSNVEALSEEESLSDPVWNIDATFYDGEVRVICKSGGEYVCPMKDPNPPIPV